MHVSVRACECVRFGFSDRVCIPTKVLGAMTTKTQEHILWCVCVCFILKLEKVMGHFATICFLFS